MRAIAFVLLALSAIACSPVIAGERFRPIEAGEGEILRSRCHMGECGWTKFLAAQVITKPNRDLVVQITQQVGASPQDEQDVQQIAWNEPSVTIVTCSRISPQVVFTSEGQRQEHNLSLTPEGIVMGYQVASVITYFQACHNLLLDEEGIDGAIKRLGYNTVALD